MLALANILALGCLLDVRVLQVARLCAGPASWRVSLGPPRAGWLAVPAGVYRVDSYGLANRFGLRSVRDTQVVVVPR
jgi:hypothetical protein